MELVLTSFERAVQRLRDGLARYERERRYSDLDLVIDASRPLSIDEAARLHESFSDSDLPYKVDVVDWQAIDDRFRRLIAAEGVLLSPPPEPSAARAAWPN